MKTSFYDHQKKVEKANINTPEIITEVFICLSCHPKKCFKRQKAGAAKRNVMSNQVQLASAWPRQMNDNPSLLSNYRSIYSRRELETG